jgi:adenylate cyclase
MRFFQKLLPWNSAPGLGLWLAALFVGIGLWREVRIDPLPLVDDLESTILEWKFQARGKLEPGGQVVLAMVDEASIRRFGRWPWPRDVFARLVTRLKEVGVRSVGFDVLFDEPDRSPGRDEAAALLGVLKAKDCLPKGPELARFEALAAHDPDKLLASAIRRVKNVILGYFLFETRGDAQGVSAEDLKTWRKLLEKARARNVRFKRELEGRPLSPGEKLKVVLGGRAPVEPLARAARKWMGYFNAKTTEKGRGFGFVLASQVDDLVLFNLTLLTVAHFLDDYPTVEYRPGRPPLILLADQVIPTEVEGRFLPNFYGPRKTFPHVSVADIVDGKAPAEALRDKLVFVGATAIAVPDQWPTPFDPAMPGVEVHATAADNILTRRYLQRPAILPVFELAFLLFLGPLVAFALGRARLLVGVALGVLILGATVAADLILFREGIFAYSALCYVEIGTVAMATYVFLYFRVFKERKRLRTTMQHYLAPSVLEEMLRDQSKLKLGGEKRELTILFSDIRSFTTLSETFDPPDLVAFLNEYFTPMTEIVLRHEGTFDKYIGDALMAFFGAPQEMTDHAVRACRAALDMKAELERLNERWKARGRPEIHVGIGMNTGPAAFGNMGSAGLFNYTVIGDQVNLASRVEGTSKMFGATIVVTETTARAAEHELLFRRLGQVYVPGRTEPSQLYEVLGRREEKGPLGSWLKAYERGLERFEARDLEGAEAAFRSATRLRPDPVAESYLNRIKELCGKTDWEVAWRSKK